MSRPVAAVAMVVAVAVFSGACSKSPTAPTPVTGSLAIASVRQEPPSVPAAVVPDVPSVLGATRFVAHGDSITCGVQSSLVFDFLVPLNCDVDWGYPERLGAMLPLYAPSQTFSVLKRGQPGEWAQDGEARLHTELQELMGPGVPLAQRPQVLMLLEGVNDMNNGVSATRAAASLAQMAQVGRLYNLSVLVATMPQTYVVGARLNSADKIQPFNAEVKRLLGGVQNIHIVDLYLAFGTNAYQTLIGDDGLHPTPAGYDLMAQQFHAAIVTTFPVRGSFQ